MYPDMNRCPQTEAEFTDYFFTLIGRTINTGANDFRAVLTAEYDWKGTRMRIPHNLPAAGQQLPKDAPFFGLTQQTDPSGNTPKARIWIPAAAPQTDENGNRWYTRYIQYVKDAPGGQPGVDMLWTWWYQSGNDYVPLLSADGGSTQPPPTQPPPTNPDLEARVVELEKKNTAQQIQIQELKGRIAALEQAPPSAGMTPEQVRKIMQDEPVWVTGKTTWTPTQVVWRGKVGPGPTK